VKRFVLLALALLSSPTAPHAEDVGASLSDWGSVGLLQNPTARMPPDGSMTGGLSGLGRLHRHLTLSAQLLPWLEVTTRDSLYPGYYGLSEPGLDVTLRLREEGDWGPALVVGGRDVTGSGLDLPGKGRFAGEYLALSRRWLDFDVTLGLGWGTLGEAGHMRNPLRFLGGRFRRDRDPSGWPTLRGPRAWFGGERIALFGGVEWRTPIPDLNLKIESSGDRFRAQRQDEPGFAPGSRYNIGLSYRPFSWIDAGAAFEQGRRAMLRLSLRFDPKEWTETDHRAPPLVGPRPSREAALPAGDIVALARAHRLPARAADITGDTATLWLNPAGGGSLPSAQEVGHAARLLADLSAPQIERLRVVTGTHGLDSASMTLLRRDVERAARHRGSVDELWRTAALEPPNHRPPNWRPNLDVSVRVASEFDLAELGAMLAHRSYSDVVLRGEPARGLVLGGALRIRADDNLSMLDTNALPASEPVRSDIPRHSGRPWAAEHLFAAHLAAPVDGLTTRLSIGHFEEMFGGVGGETLYQPLTARWAVGLDLNRVWKRRASAPLGFDRNSARLTGHASFYWENPGATTTTVLRLGRYLGADWGGGAEVIRRFEGGVALSAHATWTEGPDRGQSRFGGRMDWGMALVVPVAASGWLPVGGTLETAVRTLGRDAGQRLNQPLPLYDARVPSGFGRLAGTWSHLMD
jgi:hypothetical protein